MKKIDLGQTLGILANVGVIIGIAFLAFELNQNKELTRAQIRHELSQSLIDGILRESADTETASFVRRGLAGADLTEDERSRFYGLLMAWYRYMEDVHYQYRNGLYEDAEFRANATFWKNRLSRPAVREHWCGASPILSAEFVEAINRIAELQC